MATSLVDIPKEIEVMWAAYKRLSLVLSTHHNPETLINCGILVVQVVTSETHPESLAAFGNHLKFIFGSHKDGVLLNPT